jgi:gluconate 2-dehydrogenase subunit 3-like protein
MTISRRHALKTLGVAVAAAPIFRLKGDAADVDPASLAAIAEVVLPSEADRQAAVAGFTAWIANYKEGADTDHGYGNTRVRSTGPSPARNYPAQLAALDAQAKAGGAASFAAASLDQRRAIIENALVAAKIERLPGRPGGVHVAADLMGHYFNSSAAADLCYRAAIGRDTCRGLAGSEKKPAALPPRGGSRKVV